MGREREREREREGTDWDGDKKWAKTFSGDSHFSPYILFLPLLVSILKNAFYFGPYRYIKDGES